MKQDDSEQSTTWSFLANYMGYTKHQNQSNTTLEQQQETNKTSTEYKPEKEQQEKSNRKRAIGKEQQEK